MREINAARDLVRLSLELLVRAPLHRAQRARQRLARTGLVGGRDLRGSVRPRRALEPGRGADPVAPALRAGAPGALHRRRRQRDGRAGRRAHARPRRGLRQLGAREPAHRLGRPAGRAAADRRRGALPGRHRRPPSTPRTCAPRAGTAPCAAAPRRWASRASGPARAASGARASTTTAGATSDARWRRLRRKLRELDRVATVFAPRRSPAYREMEDGLADARGRVESLNATVAAMDAALAAAEAGVAEAELRESRTRTAGRRRAAAARARAPRRRGQARAHGARPHGRAARRAAPARRRARPRARRASSASCARATRPASARAAAVRRSGTPSARRRCASCARSRSSSAPSHRMRSPCWAASTAGGRRRTSGWSSPPLT